MRLRYILLSLLLCAALAATAWFNYAVNAPGPLAAEKLLYIAPGNSVRAITAKLLDGGIIDNGPAFLIDARWRNRQENLKAGEYNFPAGISIGGVITLLQSGKTWQRRITIPEGLEVTEVMDLLNSEPALTGAIDPRPPEGSLLPETYLFSYGDTRQGLVNRMKNSLQKELAALWEKRAGGLPLKTPEEAVILASIVEKETGLAGERPRVAGVFTNRLNRRIPLQSDPTVSYAVTQGKGSLDRALSYQDLKTPSPYNTYLVAGLPPTPIANPGKASLAAVLNPEKNDYLYFVADGSGGHVFARTLKEHNNNVARWRRLEKKAK
ncbi:MAG: endolytic transglycosylase MltG [Alphaproteobacteria bacterium]|nr:endolytic transglycosylase MltG [Alphaproteobacteria bacterium]